MSQRVKLQSQSRRAKYGVIVITLFLLMAGGCATPHPDNAFLEKAREEAAAAEIRLAKAITRYCSVTSDTVDARYACIVDRRLSILPLDQSAQLVK
jgi:hypothetical protein